MHICPAETQIDTSDVEPVVAEPRRPPRRPTNGAPKRRKQSPEVSQPADLSGRDSSNSGNSKPPVRGTAQLGPGDLTNSDRLAERFRALYTAMMDKQLGFKEAVEPFKTDNRNAGKG